MLRAMIALTRRAKADAGQDEVRVDPDLAALRGGLAEYPAEGDTAYVLRRGADGVLRAEPVEVDVRSRFGFPFIKPNGSQSAQLGPVLKRSKSPQGEVSPGLKILTTTVKAFGLTAPSENAPAAYRDALDLLGPGDERAQAEVLLAALETIHARKTVWVSLGDPPGDDPAYARWLLGLLRAERYQLDPTAPPAICGTCRASRALCENGLRGAGINFVNGDNLGKFPGFKQENISLRFAVCGDCADGLRAFKTEVAPLLKCFIAGEGALVIPEVSSPENGTALPRARGLVEQIQRGEGVASTEGRLLRTLERESSVAAFHVLWATLGQDLDDVTGMVTDVPRTRLAELSELNRAANGWCADAARPGSVLPRVPLRDELFDLHLSWTRDLLAHPGGARVKRRNNGQSLASARRNLARAVYTGGRYPEGAWFRLLRETAESYLREALERDDRGIVHWLQREDEGADSGPRAKLKAPRSRYLTCAGWIRHAALCTRYLQRLKVIETMSDEEYVPDRERLRAFFQGSGIRSDAQAFGFLLGALWGKLVTIQAARGVNVKSNALSWLRRGALCGDDLPRLFAQTRMKLLEYEFHTADSADVLHEIARLGTRLGDRVDLDNDRTMYFLLLGQACAGELMPSKEKATS